MEVGEARKGVRGGEDIWTALGAWLAAGGVLAGGAWHSSLNCLKRV